MTDATGVPTSPDGIPTYNTSSDAPSGLGFNTAMAALQALFTNLRAGTGVAKIVPAGISPGSNGQVLTTTGGAAAWGTGTGLKTTVGTLAAGPPGSPATNDIWIATDVDANGTIWSFRYNSAEATYKWEFVGGSRVGTRIDTSESTASASYVDLSTVGPNVTLARAGDYWVEYGFIVSGNSGANATSELFVGGTDLGVGLAVQAVNASGGQFSAATVNKILGRSAADVLKFKHNVSNAVSTNFFGRYIYVLPIRVI